MSRSDSILSTYHIKRFHWAEFFCVYPRRSCPPPEMALCCRRVIFLRPDGIRLHEGPSRSDQVLTWFCFDCFTYAELIHQKINLKWIQKAGISIWSFFLLKVFQECFSNVCLSISNPLQQLFNCSLLYRLSLPDNDLTVLPPAIANLTNLRELDVSKNSKQNGQFTPPPSFSSSESSYASEQNQRLRYGLTEPSSTVTQLISSSSSLRCYTQSTINSRRILVN